MVTFLPRFLAIHGAIEETCAFTSVMPGWKV